MLAWRQHHGPAPVGLTETPARADDGNWYALVKRPGLGSVLGISRYGFGDVTSDLQAFNISIAAGDGYLGAGEWDNAVNAYQGAGNTGAQVLGPEIDAQTQSASVPFTQQAWAINGNLASVTNSGATQNDATAAQGYVRQMQNLYTQGASTTPAVPAGSTPTATTETLPNIVIQGSPGGSSGGSTPTAPAPGTTTTTTTTSTTTATGKWNPWIIGGAVVAGVAIVGYAYYRRGKGGRRVRVVRLRRR